MTREAPSFINPDSPVTKLAIYKEPSAYGLPKRRIVVVGEDSAGRPIVYLGSTGQLMLFLEIRKGTGRIPDSASAFQQQETFESTEPEMEDPSQMDRLRAAFEDGDQLIAGPHVSRSRPGESPTVDPDRVGVWAPLSAVSASGWTLMSE